MGKTRLNPLLPAGGDRLGRARTDNWIIRSVRYESRTYARSTAVPLLRGGVHAAEIRDDMDINGKLYVLEGIDGSGKTTQYNRLLARAAREGKALAGTTFPNYESPSGKLVSQYLSGAFGSRPGDVNAFAAASIFAVDRFASYKTDAWGEILRSGGTVLSARYTTSNAIHQAAKLPDEEWPAFFRWLAEYEYGYLELPIPVAVYFLHLPAETALRLIAARANASGAARDIHEQDASYLLRCAQAAEAAADFFGWTRVPVTENGEMLPEAAISDRLCRMIGLWERKQ